MTSKSNKRSPQAIHQSYLVRASRAILYLQGRLYVEAREMREWVTSHCPLLTSIQESLGSGARSGNHVLRFGRPDFVKDIREEVTDMLDEAWSRDDSLGTKIEKVIAETETAFSVAAAIKADELDANRPHLGNLSLKRDSRAFDPWNHPDFVAAPEQRSPSILESELSSLKEQFLTLKGEFELLARQVTQLLQSQV